MDNERNILASRVGITGIICNFALFILKIVIGIISKSHAMIADSLNSAGDVFASFMTWLGNRISSVPNDEDHNYGHGKAEYIFSMLIGISMIVVAIKLLYDSVMSIIVGNELIFSWKLVIVSIITIITKLILYLYTRIVYKKSDNLLVKSNMLDHRNDILLTSLTLLAIILAYNHIYFFDGVVGIFISIWIMITGIKIFMESYNVLMDQAIDNDSKKEILNILKSKKDVLRIGDIYTIPIGYKYILIATIYVDGKMKTKESHKIADLIENDIKKKILKVENVIIHIEPFMERRSYGKEK